MRKPTDQQLSDADFLNVIVGMARKAEHRLKAARDVQGATDRVALDSEDFIRLTKLMLVMYQDLKCLKTTLDFITKLASESGSPQEVQRVQTIRTEYANVTH